MIALTALGERLENVSQLDTIARPIAKRASALYTKLGLKDVLSGSWLGHPLHPMLTDLPIGSWTSATLLDLVGGERAEKAADLLVLTGVVTAVPTAATGASDLSDLGEREKRVGVVHAVSNSIALVCYGASAIARRRGARTRGVALGLVGAAAASFGGLLGGHLTFRTGAGVDRNAFESLPAEWSTLAIDALPADGEMTAGRAAGIDVVVVGHQGGHCALADRCSHQGGPLHEGELVDGRVRCPWHASEFDVTDGRVVHGPATAPQPVFELDTSTDPPRVRHT